MPVVDTITSMPSTALILLFNLFALRKASEGHYAAAGAITTGHLVTGVAWVADITTGMDSFAVGVTTFGRVWFTWAGFGLVWYGMDQGLHRWVASEVVAHLLSMPSTSRNPFRFLRPFRGVAIYAIGGFAAVVGLVVRAPFVLGEYLSGRGSAEFPTASDSGSSEVSASKTDVGETPVDELVSDDRQTDPLITEEASLTTSGEQSITRSEDGILVTNEDGVDVDSEDINEIVYDGPADRSVSEK